MAERQMRDARGNLIEFSASGGRVTVYVSDEFAELDADQQEELAQLYTATCWQAAQDEGAAGRPHPAVESGDADSGGEPAAGATGAGAPAAGELEALAREMLATFTKTSDGHRARVGQVRIAKWTERLERGSRG